MMVPDKASSRSPLSSGKRVRSGSRVVARHRIRESLHRRITSGQVQPGSKLVQQQLARQFGVSMGLIREALLELQAWGLVEVHDNRGIFVCQWDAERIKESYEVREVLEGLAARRCCGRVTADQVEKLRQIVEQIYRTAGAQEWDENTRLERKFHGEIVRLSASHMVIRLAENYRFLRKMVWVASDPDSTRQSHLDILAAIESNDPDRAERLARSHVASGKQTIEQRIAAQVFLPHWVE
jgi:DNA-binding GntR family transcriptional regulator